MRHWVVWCNAWLGTDRWAKTYKVDIATKTRNEALKKGNKKLGIPRSRRTILRIFERTPMGIKVGGTLRPGMQSQLPCS